MLGKFIADLRNYHALNPEQQKNASALLEISEKFHKKALITGDDIRVESDHTIILESGHQPNFLPHAGTWKKAFLLHHIQSLMKNSGSDVVAFFGFADRNLSTARILSKNQIPAINKEGSIKIGFTINDTDRFKSFHSVHKPAPDTWEREIARIQNHYMDIVKKTRSKDVFNTVQWEEIHELLCSSYNRADNFAELNSFIFSRLCNEVFGIHLNFFMYSDMYQDNLFLKESQELLHDFTRLNETCNNVIRYKKLEIPEVAHNHLPFWYTCTCGAKLDLQADESFTSVVICPLCKKKYELEFGQDFQNLIRYYSSMDFTAVSRNCIMAHGLGDTLFISGFGGSLQYGQIADQISRDLGFHRPRSLGWRSGDLYLGMAHRAAVHELMQYFSLTAGDLLTPALHQNITCRFNQITDAISEAERPGNEKDRKYWTGMESNANNQLIYAKNIFSITPSFLDIMANVDADLIIQKWKEALSKVEIQLLHDVCLMQNDIKYPTHFLSEIPPNNLPELYENIRKIEVRECPKRS